MSDAALFDVILFGCRNDLARARALDFLATLPVSDCGPSPLEFATPLPQRLFTGLERRRAEELRAQLEALGAQVTLLRVAQPDAGEWRATAAGPRAARKRFRLSTLFVLLLLGAALAVWRAVEHRQPPAPPPAPVTPQKLEPLPRSAQPSDDAEAARLNAEAIRLAEAGQFHEAVDRLQKAVRRAPDQPLLSRNLQTVLLNWGTSDLNAHRLEDAALHLREALQQGERSELLRALGITYLRQEDYAGAILVLERALQLTPNDQGSMLVLGQIYLKQEKRPEALALLQRAKELGASDPELDKMLDQLGREVDTEWSFVQLESRHFRVSFAGTEERSTARLVLGALEEAYDDVGRKLGYSPDQRLTAVLYTAEDFRAVTRTPDWVGGVFDGRIKLPVRGLEADDPDLGRVLRHEYAHSVVTLLAGPRCPAWLNEGIAVWAEEAEAGDHQRWAEQTLAAHGTFSFDALSDSFAQLPVDGAEAAYAQSYLAVQSLVDHYGSRRLVEFLGALSRGTNVSDAFAEVYRDGLEGFQEQLLHGYSG